MSFDSHHQLHLLPSGYGQTVGEVFGDIYGNLFAKDVLWMFRNPTRAQRFPAAWMDGVVGGLGGSGDNVLYL